MAKFGELIDIEIPVLIEFYKTDHWAQDSLKEALNSVAENFRKKARVVRIDIEKNNKLAQALKIAEVPTLVLYRQGEMVWRKSGLPKAEELIAQIEKLL